MRFNLIATISIVLILSGLVMIFISLQEDASEEGLLGDVHEHADFKVYLNNQHYNFTQEKYMSSEDNHLSPFIHLHDMDGEVIHKHASEITLDFLFESINMAFNSTCFVLDDGKEYCNQNDRTIKMYVNGIRNYEYEDYEFNDLDRILISYGNDSENVINKQIDSITDNACIQSGKCPERGNPSDESSCTAQGGCVA